MKITWLGDHTDETGGPRVNVWNGIKFTIGEPVEVTDAGMIAKARTHPQYRIEGKQEKTHVEIKEGKEEQEVGDIESKEENQKDYDYRQAEKGSGYTPVKKKVRKKKAGGAPPVPDPDADA